MKSIIYLIYCGLNLKFTGQIITLIQSIVLTINLLWILLTC